MPIRRLFASCAPETRWPDPAVLILHVLFAVGAHRHVIGRTPVFVRLLRHQFQSGLRSPVGFAADKPFADSAEAAINGFSNCTPRRKYWRSGVQRKTVACSNETECGNWALLVNAVGTSRVMWVLGST